MMTKIQHFVASALTALATISALTTSQLPVVAADNQESAADKQRKLITILQSDAPPQDKAIPCKQLAVYGDKEAVPALAPLLLDPQLSSWARIALEAIPDRAADDALREAMGKLQGRLLVGVINSIAVRRDANAVNALVNKLKDSDAEVASAAAVALGRIGGEAAANALKQSLASAPDAVRSAVAQGCILCAEKFAAAGPAPTAIELFDLVRQSTAPKNRRVTATRGAILARQNDGIPLLLEQLRSPDKAYWGIGLITARELPGRPVTDALAAELNRTSPDRQAALLLAIADRQDDAVLPTVIGAAKSRSKGLRLAAVSALEGLGGGDSVAVLLEAAADSDAEIAQAGMASLARLAGANVDADLLARLTQTTGKTRQALIELTAQRRTEGALPVIMRYADDPDAGVRAAAIEAVGNLGDEKQAGDLVRLLQTTRNPKDQANLEKALLAISRNSGAAAMPQLLGLAQNKDSALRIIALHSLASVGGSDALAAVKAAISDPVESVQDEAVRALSTWPNNWPEDAGVEEPLLTLAKTAQKTSHQVLGVRGYLQFVQGDKQLKNPEKAVKLNSLLPVIKRPEEKRMAIAVLGAIPVAGVLEPLLAFAADSATAEEACSAIVGLAGKRMAGVSAEQLKKALETVVEKTQNDATKKKAEDALKRMR